MGASRGLRRSRHPEKETKWPKSAPPFTVERVKYTKPSTNKVTPSALETLLGGQTYLNLVWGGILEAAEGVDGLGVLKPRRAGMKQTRKKSRKNAGEKKH